MIYLLMLARGRQQSRQEIQKSSNPHTAQKGTSASQIQETHCETSTNAHPQQMASKPFSNQVQSQSPGNPALNQNSLQQPPQQFHLVSGAPGHRDPITLNNSNQVQNLPQSQNTNAAASQNVTAQSAGQQSMNQNKLLQGGGAMAHMGRNAGLQNHHLSDALTNQNSEPASQVNQAQANSQQNQSQSQVPNQVPSTSPNQNQSQNQSQNNSSNVNTPQQVQPQASTPSNTPSEIHGYRQTSGGRQAHGDHWQSMAETVISNHVSGLNNALRDTMNSFREDLRAEYENEIKEQMHNDTEGQTDDHGKREGNLDDGSEAGTGAQEEMGNRTMSPNNYTNLTSSISKEHLE